MIWRLAVLVLVALLAVMAIPAIRHWRETPPPPPPAIHAAFEAPAGAELGSGDDVLDAAISPDGQEIAFVATSDGMPHLWRRRLDEERAERIAGTDGASLPAWKRNGRVASFFAAGHLRQVALPDRDVRDLVAAPFAGGAAWLPDGSLLYADDPRGPIRRLKDGRSSNATTLREGDVAHAFPQAVDGDAFVYVAQLAGGRRLVRLAHAGGERDLARTSGHALLIDDRLIHVVDGALTVQQIDRAGGSLVGRPARLAFDVGVTAPGHGFFAASRRVAVWAAASLRARELVWFDAKGQRTDALGEPGDYWQARLSPDDRTVAATVLDPLLRTLDVFVRPAAEGPGTWRRVTLSLSADSDPVWSADSSRILFRSLQGGQPNLFARPAAYAAQQDDGILRSDLDETPTDWRAGIVLFHAPGKATGLDVLALDTRTGMASEIANSGFNEFDARWSPDGALIAYVSEEPGRPEVLVQRWPAKGRASRATFAGGTRPRWGRDGSLYFLRDGILMRTILDRRGDAIAFGTASRVADLQEARDYDVAHASDRILAVVPATRSRTARAGVIVDW
jgi:hypothetical protein